MTQPKALFSKPVGPSDQVWNTESRGTTRAVTCEGCGKEWPELGPDDSSYALFTFLGKQLAEDCCGKLIDQLFNQFGLAFTQRYLEQYAENPRDPQFNFLAFLLPDLLKRAKENAGRVAARTADLQGQLE